MAIQVWPQEETDRRLRKTKFIKLRGPRDRRHSMPHRATLERNQGGQKAEDNIEGKI